MPDHQLLNSQIGCGKHVQVAIPQLLTAREVDADQPSELFLENVDPGLARLHRLQVGQMKLV